MGINRRRCSKLWWRIVEPLYEVNSESNMVTAGMRMNVGNGALINFWDEVWLNDMILKVLFPRIFSLAVNKNGKISEYGEWIDDKWVWRIHLRLNLFGWEQNQWDELLVLLENVCLSLDFKDKLIWKHSSSGTYSAKDYYKFVCFSNSSPDPLWSKIWLGLAPPKVETFLWQALRGRIAVKSLLCARVLIMVENANCPICNEVPESTDYLFLECKSSWLVWQFFCAKGKVSWVMPEDLSSAFRIWMGVSNNSVWRMTFYAILWTLWTARNDLVFNGILLRLLRFKTLLDTELLSGVKLNGLMEQPLKMLI
ncbi:hypothetical protein COLO4_35424 [Corchorus olitorius]|uniref:Reverse transcriptase zinc-binding domain-containing protein n=1 Tax=Corchorus olitorius TaxID=93759 RepID=A0A1R3GGZ4_9ROSI|nr:hypothetical protein COLO4_35424 [Corchorus olitorius]